MATAAHAPVATRSEYHEETGIWSWLTTVDHKRIGILYLYTALTWFLVGGDLYTASYSGPALSRQN